MAVGAPRAAAQSWSEQAGSINVNFDPTYTYYCGGVTTHDNNGYKVYEYGGDTNARWSYNGANWSGDQQWISGYDNGTYCNIYGPNCVGLTQDEIYANYSSSAYLVVSGYSASESCRLSSQRA